MGTSTDYEADPIPCGWVCKVYNRLKESMRADHLVTREYVDEKFKHLDFTLEAMRESFGERIEKSELRMTIKTGAMLFVSIGFLAAIKFFGT